MTLLYSLTSSGGFFIQLKLRKPIGRQNSKLDIGLQSATCLKEIVLEHLMLKAILKTDRY